MKRFFIEKINNNNDIIIVDGEEFHHMNHVLRLKENDSIEICFNDGFIWSAIITKMDKKQATVTLVECRESKCESKTALTAFQALCKGEKMDLIAQKLTELGIDSLVPFESKFTVVKLGANASRLQKVAIQSSKQCGRAVALKVEEAISFSQMLNRLKEFDLVVFANETENNNFLGEIQHYYGKKVAMIVGSEGGFDADEIHKIVQCNAQSISLGKRILRCETAAIALGAIIMFSLGELGDSK